MVSYVNCGSGIAGDMLLGAQIGLGLDRRELELTLKRALGGNRWALKIRQTERQHWPAWSLEVVGDHAFGPLQKMRRTVSSAKLPTQVKAHALAIFDRLATAERAAHGRSQAKFDPKGLGLFDTLVDVVGNCWGFWKLGLEEIIASPINTGRVAPATAHMLRASRTPIFSTEPSRELATPTGVAILLQFARGFEAMPAMTLDKSGYGAGKQDIPGRPNVVGVHVGTAVKTVLPVMPVDQLGKLDKPAKPAQPQLEPVILLETIIDDMDPRLYPHVMDLLLKEGALDVWWTPIGMKKGRPGIAFSVLCHPPDESRLSRRMFQETTTLGIRRQPIERRVLPRHASGGHKIALLPGGQRRVRSEFEIAKKTAAARAQPLVKLLK